ncbi:MAG: sortase [Actinobacteria bacterium]|nr:sortase [Actinomycetota bacterium]
MFLLAIATMMFSLVLLSATSSGAQTGSEDQHNSAKAAVGGDECVEFGNESSNTGTTNGDTNTNTSEDTSLSANQDNATGDNIASDNSTNDNANATDANPDTGGDTGTDTGATNQDAGTGTNGEDFTTSQDQGTGSEDGTTLQDDATGGDGTTSSQDGKVGNEECVVADTVPDESLLPTGAPASSSRTDEKTAKKKNSGTQEKTSGGEVKSKSDRSETQSKAAGGGTTREKTTSSEARKKSNGTGKQQRTTGSNTRKKKGSGTQKKTSSGETQNTSGSVETTQVKSNRSETQSNSGSGGTVAVRGREVEVDDRAGKEPRQEELKARARSAAASDLAPRLAATEWTRPSREEIVSTSKPRNFAPNPKAGMTLSARALGLYDMPVTSSDRREDLDNGLVHVPETSRPWDEGGQKNVFIAGHYLGAPQTPSRLAFYNLHKLKKGDELVLEDGWGQAYKYRVSEKFAVEPGDSWAMGEVRDRDMVTLQTCIPPDFGKRLMVRADRVQA